MSNIYLRSSSNQSGRFGGPGVGPENTTGENPGSDVNKQIHYPTTAIMQATFYALPPIKDTVSGLKRQGHNELSGPCPFCGGKDRFVVFTKGKDRFICRGCLPGGGDRIELHRRLYRHDKAIDLARVTVPHMFDGSIPPPALRHQTREPISPARQEKPMPDFTEYINGLPSSEDVEKYIMALFVENRGIDYQIVKDHIKRENIRYTTHKGVPAVVIPYGGENGKIPAVQLISVNGKAAPFPGCQGQDKKFLKGSKASAPCFFHAGVSLPKTDTLMIHEGVIDAISGAQLFPDSCHVALGGSTYIRKVNVLKIWIRGNIKRIIVCQDNDPAGDKMVNAVRAILGSDVCGIEWEDDDHSGMDINDLLRAMQERTAA